MSKCKKNILLIFGFLLIVNLLFIPCNEIYYSLSLTADKNIKKNRWERANYVKVFFPVIFNRATEYKKYVEWESEAFLIFDKKAEVRKELEKEFNKTDETFIEYLYRKDMDEKTYQKLKNEKGLSQNTKLSMKLYEINEEITKTYRKKQNESSEKFKYPTIYHQFSTKFFLGELVLLILVGSLAYIFFCVALRKMKKMRVKIREWRADRIKRRKAGIILILIGVGIPMALVPFVSGGWIDILAIQFQYPLSIGIILSLIGVGMVIFSFFPKDTNPKK